VSGIENGIPQNNIMVTTFSISPCPKISRQGVWALATADLYPNEVSGIENGTTLNDIKVKTFSISPYAKSSRQSSLT